MRAIPLAGMIGLALAAAAGAGHAQNACAKYMKQPPVGSWSSYSGPEGTFRLAVVGSEKRNGKTLYRFEAQADTKQQGAGVFQILVPAFPWNMADAEEMVVKQQGQPAMRVSGQMMAMMRKNAKDDPVAGALRECNKMTDLGEESVTVPAGTFKARHFKDPKTGVEVWGTPEVAFGAVKTVNEGKTYVLAGTGTDAKSAITETPMDMPAMPGN